MATLASWVADPACAGNATTLTIAGIIYTNEEDCVEALKACHTGLSLEMCVPLLALFREPPDQCQRTSCSSLCDVRVNAESLLEWFEIS